jgi:hypothetical protein
VSPGIDGIKLDGCFRKFEGSPCLVEIAHQAGVHVVFDVVHLHETAVTRRERGILTDGIAKDGDRPLPAFGVKFRHQVLPAQPSVVNIERNVRFAGKPHQPFGR